MRALQLFSPAHDGIPKSSSCLLVYSESNIREATISSDVRQVYAESPSTAHIFVLAPFSDPADTLKGLTEGTSLIRAKSFIEDGCTFNILRLSRSAERLDIVSVRLSWDGTKIKAHPEVRLDERLKNAWLFDLFDRNGGRVTSPIGVHFRKTSGRHTDKFLRTANVLLSSDACGLIAFFALANFGAVAPRRILVDTAPLIAVAQAMFNIAQRLSIWFDTVPIRSFSSYGGLQAVSRISQSDWVLVSASTSGSLVEAIKSCGAAPENIVTLYFLQSDDSSTLSDGVLCDLTYRTGNNFGYSQILNFRSGNCPLCDKGYILADLEGDQFLFQKRPVHRIKVRQTSQKKRAREILEALTRKNLLKVRPQPAEQDRILLSVTGDDILQDKPTRAALVRQLRRFCPSPLEYVVLYDVTESAAQSLLRDAQISYETTNVTFLAWSQLAGAPQRPEAGALVLFGFLNDHGKAREINALLRRTVPKGAVTYLSALTIADTPDELFDLTVFLTYGEFGRDTFIMRSVHELAFPMREGSRTAWVEEYELLASLCSEEDAAEELQQRKKFLETHPVLDSQLFVTRKDVDLSINNDFVYLNTGDRRDLISQSDVVAVVANILASARAHDREIDSGRSKDIEARMRSTLYGHALLCPENFRIYNDAILRAAFLRLGNYSEMGYSVDETCSREMLEIIIDEMAAWDSGAANALPEFFIALCSGRLSLDDRHMALLKQRIDETSFPNYLQQIIDRISF